MAISTIYTQPAEGGLKSQLFLVEISDIPAMSDEFVYLCCYTTLV